MKPNKKNLLVVFCIPYGSMLRSSGWHRFDLFKNKLAVIKSKLSHHNKIDRQGVLRISITELLRLVRTSTCPKTEQKGWWIDRGPDGRRKCACTWHFRRTLPSSSPARLADTRRSISPQRQNRRLRAPAPVDPVNPKVPVPGPAPNCVYARKVLSVLKCKF